MRKPIQVKGKIRLTYNQEVSQVEFELMRLMKNTQKIFTSLIKAEGYTINPFVTQLEVTLYRNLKVKGLQDLQNEPQIQPFYFKTDKIKSFISETSKELKDLFKKWDIVYYKEGRNIS